jgi:hypothetical protein
MNRIIKGYGEFIKKNEEFQDSIINDEDANLEASTPDDTQEVPHEGNSPEIAPEASTDVVDEYEGETGYIGDRAMKQLAEALGVEPMGNTIEQDGTRIEYVAEFDGFLVKGANTGTKKIPVVAGDIEDAVNRVMDLVGSAVLSEKKVIDTKKSKDKDEKIDDKKVKNLGKTKKKK